MIPRILVIGATGLLGEPVARALRGAGFGVRVMSRQSGLLRRTFPDSFELFEGDALNRADTEKALRGCGGVHISIDHDQEDQCVARVIESAKSQGLTRITYVSGTTVCEENRWFPLVDRKLKAERAIVASGVDYTILCPGWFMELLERLVRHGRAVVFGRASRRWHMVAAQDFARMVSESYRRPEASNKRFHVHGPEGLTVVEALRSYCQALHPEVGTPLRVPAGVARVIAWLRGSAEMRAGVDMVTYLERVGERGDPQEANAILGAPQITLSQWLQTRPPRGGAHPAVCCGRICPIE